MATREEIERSRAKRREEHDKARAAQELLDLEAIDKMESDLGESLHTMTANTFKPGVAVRIAFRSPTAAEYKRYCDMVGKAQTKGDVVERRRSQEMMAEACLMYPEEGPARKAMCEAFPGLLLSLAIEAAKRAELAAEDEAKN